MPSEQRLHSQPAVPSFWRFGWMLFLQPLRFDTLFARWDFKEAVSLKVLLWRSNAGDPVARALLRYSLLWLIIVMPSVSVMVEAIVMLARHVNWTHVGGGLSGALVGAFVISLFDVRPAVVFGVVFGVTASVVWGSAEIASDNVLLPWMWFETSLVFGGGCGVLMLIFGKEPSSSIVGHVAMSLLVGFMTATVVYVATGLPLVVAFGVMGGMVTGMALGTVSGATIGMMAEFALQGGGLYVGVVLGLVTFFVFGESVGISFGLAALTMFILRLPAFGLRTFVTRLAMDDEALGKALLEEMSSSGKKTLVDSMLVDLQGQSLERAATKRLFGHVVDLDFPFFPTVESIADASPLRVFQAAAQDLAAGGASHDRRKDGLKRARRRIETFRNTVASEEMPDSLSVRLLKTARVWLGVIAEQEIKLAQEQVERPEVPAVFVAGSPLTPDRVEQRDLFKSRGDLIKRIEHDLAPDRSGILLVVGQRRMGKTSLRNWLPTYLGTGTTVIVADFQSLSGKTHRETPHRVLLDAIVALAPNAPKIPESSLWGDGLRWFQEFDRSLDGQSVLVVIDEIERVEDGIRDKWCTTDFLDFLRAAGDSLRRIRFLLLTAYPLHRLGPHWLDRLVSATTRSISYLDEADARDLICHPIPDFPDIYPAGGVDLILTQTGRHPYLLQKVGDELCRLLNARGGRRQATSEELTEVFDGIIRGADLFDELWRQRTENERAALRRLARASEPIAPDPASLQLVREGYLERRGEKVTITVPLFREWIVDTQGSVDSE